MNLPIELINDMELVDDDDLDVLELLYYGIPKQIYKRANYFVEMDSCTFRKRFRLSKEAVCELLVQIEDKLSFPYDSNNCVSPMNQLLTTLRLYSTGGHLDAVADFAGMHLSTVSRIIQRVSNAIASLKPSYINMPTATDSIRKIQQDFFNVASFPRVIGAIDCSHFKIISPGGEDPEIFRNRKGYFSINGQFVCNANLEILNVVARWPGSTHDSTIFNNSYLKRDFENGRYPQSSLPGDNGYANQPYLLTPLLNPTTNPEKVYNKSHIITRNTIERLFGVLKKRFPILAYGCRLKLNTFLTIIVATSVLHNLALSMGDKEPPPVTIELDEHVLNQLIESGSIPNVQVRGELLATTRSTLINDYFINIINIWAKVNK